MIIIDILIAIGLLTTGVLIDDSLLSTVLIFASGGWCMFIIEIWRRK